MILSSVACLSPWNESPKATHRFREAFGRVKAAKTTERCLLVPKRLTESPKIELVHVGSGWATERKHDLSSIFSVPHLVN